MVVRKSDCAEKLVLGAALDPVSVLAVWACEAGMSSIAAAPIRAMKVFLSIYPSRKQVN